MKCGDEFWAKITKKAVKKEIAETKKIFLQVLKTLQKTLIYTQKPFSRKP